MVSTSFAELDSPERLRAILAERGYFPDAAPADRLFDLPPDQRSLLSGAQIIALAGPASDDNTLVALHVPRATLPLDLLRRMRRWLAGSTRDGLIFCAESWQQATLYLLRQEDIPQPGQEQPGGDALPTWELNFNALRPADRQGLALLDLRDEDPYELGAALWRAFRRAQRPTIYQNQGLFSNYYLNERLERDADAHNDAWRALAAAMPALRPQIETALAAGSAGLDRAATEAQVIRPLLAALGWKPDARSSAGQLDLRVGGDIVAFCHTLPFDAPLDLAPLPGDLLAPPPLSPDMQLIGRLAGQKSVLWGILTNGRAWRLLSRQATSTSGVFYEIDLRDLLEIGAADDRDLRWFAAFFGAAWLQAPAGAPGMLDRVYQSGQLWAETLGNDLKAAIFKDVFVDFANALAEGQRRAGREPDLPTVYRATLVLLYRLLFVLYAESRRLLPLTDAAYYPNSLTYLLSTLALKQNGLVPAERNFSLDTADPRLWLKLRALFEAIGAGQAAWNVPHYNGGLFADETSAAHRLLTGLDAVANDYLCKGLDRLARDEDARSARDENAALRLIDYMDLNVRRLGSIYEGLLEFQLRRTETHGEIVEGRLAPVSARKNRKNSGRLVQTDEVYLETTRQDRKASGSYYTPDYIVKYIVEQTVGPVLDGRAARFRELMSQLHQARTTLRRAEQRIDNPRYDLHDYRAKEQRVSMLEDQAIDALLDIKVLDPAMGSGHFLVEAVNYLSDHVIAVLRDHPDNPLLPRLARVRADIRANLQAQGIAGAVISDEQLSDRVLLRRMVMKRCIYGVDLNEMAVDLAKLSLWLDSFAVGAPLSFLDHHLRWGNSLVGIWDVEHYIDSTSPRWMTFMNALGYMVQVTRLTDSTSAEVAESKALYEQAQAELAPFRAQFNVDLAVHFAALGDVAQARRVAHTPAAERAAAHAVESLAKFDTAQQEADARRFFHWKLEFPEVFVDHEKRDWKADGAAGFDAVVGNPPYVDIKGLEKPLVKYLFHAYETMHLRINIFAAFLERALRSANIVNGYVAFILPSALLTQISYAPLRRNILANFSLISLVRLPNELFGNTSGDVKVDTCAIVVAPSGSNSTTVLVYEGFERIVNISAANATKHFVFPQRKWMENDEAAIIINSDSNEVVVNKMGKYSYKLEQICEFCLGLTPYDKYRGHSEDLIKNKAFHSNQKINENYQKLLISGDVNRYSVEWNGEEWIKYGKWLAAPRKKIFFTGSRILVQQIIDWSSLRLMIGWTDEEIYNTQNQFILLARGSANLSFVLSIIASTLISYFHRKVFLDLALQRFQKILIKDAKTFPIRRIHFTTPDAERARLAGAANALAAVIIAGDDVGAAGAVGGVGMVGDDDRIAGRHGGLPLHTNDDNDSGDVDAVLPVQRGANGWPRFDAVAYRATALGRRVAALLPQDEQGAFIAFAEGATGAEEWSDVVHDVLAALAEQMIDLNRQKQAETKRFLGWLEAQLDITTDKNERNGIDSLPGKTTLQNYLGDYQKNEAARSWDDVYAVLHKNRKRFVNDYWLTGMFGAQLTTAYADSLATLLPIKARLARTDALIDQIVYQLYGLTEDEIAVVEGR